MYSVSSCSRPTRSAAALASRSTHGPPVLTNAGTALAESLVSVTTHGAVKDSGSFAVGMSNSTTFLRPVTGGYVHAEGRPLHRGRTTWVWDVTFTDDEGRVCAVTRVTMAVRPAPNS